MKIVNEGFEFPNLNSRKYPGLRTHTYSLVYNIPISIFKSLKGMDNLLVWMFINQTANYHTNILTIDSSWRKSACKAINLDEPRLARALKHLKTIEFICISDNRCRLNPFVSSKGRSNNRETIVDNMEKSAASLVEEMV